MTRRAQFSTFTMRTIGYAFLGLSVLAMCGCASVVSGRRAEVTFHSNPTQAHVTVRDHTGKQVAALQTPGVVELKRNRRFLLPARYTATFEAPGYEPVEVPIRYTLNPWVFGNVLFGGVAGIVIDNATGAVWKPRVAEFHQELAPAYGAPSDPSGWQGDAIQHAGSEPQTETSEQTRIAERAGATQTDAGGWPSLFR